MTVSIVLQRLFFVQRVPNLHHGAVPDLREELGAVDGEAGSGARWHVQPVAGECCKREQVYVLWGFWVGDRV